MKVYVVCAWYSYEGNGNPEKAFDSAEKAKEYIATKSLEWCDGYEYYELEVE